MKASRHCYTRSFPLVFLRKSVLKICRKFTGENPCRSVISINLQSNFVEITLRQLCPPVNLQQIFRTHFPENTSGGCRALWSIVKTFLPLSFSMLNIFYESLGTNLINPFIPSVVVKLRPPRFTSKDLIRPIEVFVKRFGVLRSDARQNKTPNFPTKWTFLPPDTQTHVCVSEGKKCLFFRKIGRALFSWNTHIDIRLLIYYRRKSGLTSIDSTYVIDSFWGGAWCSFAAVFQDHL